MRRSWRLAVAALLVSGLAIPVGVGAFANQITGPAPPGYWLVSSDGGVFTYGASTSGGSHVAGPLTQPIVAMAASNSGKGYWLLAADAWVSAYGDATLQGGLG